MYEKDMDSFIKVIINDAQRVIIIIIKKSGGLVGGWMDGWMG